MNTQSSKRPLTAKRIQRHKALIAELESAADALDIQAAKIRTAIEVAQTEFDERLSTGAIHEDGTAKSNIRQVMERLIELES